MQSSLYFCLTVSRAEEQQQQRLATVCYIAQARLLAIRLLRTVFASWHQQGARCSSVVRAFAYGCEGSSDRSFIMDPLSYFLVPVLHDWCNKGCGMCYPVCGIMHTKVPLLLIRKISPCLGSGFPLSLPVCSCTICLTPYNRK